MAGAAVLLGAAGPSAPADDPDAPHYDANGNLVFPAGYREWVFLSAGLDMTYAGEKNLPKTSAHLFENVFAPPSGYRYFANTGTWPDKTVLFMERRAGETNVSINLKGFVQTGVQGYTAHVKDTAHDKNRYGWAFYLFGPDDKTGKLVTDPSLCAECHEKNGAVDTTFVQFYPTLIPIAKEHGTYKPPPGD
ncbi:MAG: cytochrome P460 family protein [Rhizomicrobium sp.]